MNKELSNLKYKLMKVCRTVEKKFKKYNKIKNIISQLEYDPTNKELNKFINKIKDIMYKSQIDNINNNNKLDILVIVNKVYELSVK